jgi:hypothetical protein
MLAMRPTHRDKAANKLEVLKNDFLKNYWAVFAHILGIHS